MLEPASGYLRRLRETHDVDRQAVGAVLLLGVYAAWVVSYLRGGGGQEPALEHEHAPPLGFRAGIVVLASAGVAAASMRS